MNLKPNNNKPVSEIDLDPFQNAVNESAARVRGLWLGYIALLAYLFIAVAAVTHRDLLLENPVNLPVLQVKLPLVGFFAVAPMFFLINHLFLLLQLFGLGQRLREFNDEITKTDLDEAARRQARRKLDTFVIVQMLAGPKRDREQVTGMFQRVIAIITLVIAPIILLLIIQLQFLPYQYELITWMHRLILAIDLVLLWMFWPSIKLGEWATWRGKRLPKWQGRVHWGDYIVSWRQCCVSWWQTLAIMAVTFFACTIATFPGEIADGGINAQHWSKPDDSNLSSLKGQLFGNLSPTKTREQLIGNLSPSKFRERLFPFSRAIDLADDKTLIDLDSFDKINKRHRGNQENLKPWQTGRTLSLRNRNLRGAMLDRTDLRNVDLFAAQLQGASLYRASLQGASLLQASLQGASLLRASLRGAILEHASLQGVSLRNASLQSASLDNASLQGASLDYASLQGASLGRASLQSASLDNANLQGASLQFTSLQGASLKRASLQGASLVWAHLQGAILERASLQGARLEHASLQGASLRNASLQGASLYNASLQGASLGWASLQGASLDNASLQGVSLHNASLQGASLGTTFLWRAYGMPDSESLETVWVIAPELSALSSVQLARLEIESIEGVASEDVKKRIKHRLERLSEPKKDLVDVLPERFWTVLEGKVSEVDHQKPLAMLLETQVCDDETPLLYVAQGIIRYRLGNIGSDHLPRVARKLLDDAEGRTIDCPGLKGLNAESIDQLRKWAAKPIAGAKSQEKPKPEDKLSSQ